MIGGIYGYLAIALGAVLAIGGAYFKGHSAGADSVHVAYLQRDNEAAQKNLAKIRELSQAVRSKEQQKAEELAKVSQNYQRELAQNEARKNALLDDVVSGRIRLYVNTRKDGDSGKPAGETTATACRCDGREEGGFLGQADTAFLVGEASRADQVAKQLGACQAVARKDRGG